jgi:hypothetical protein
MEARVFLVGPWTSDIALVADLRSAVRRMGGELCEGVEAATSIVRVHRIGAERWIEAEPPLVRAATARPTICAFELVIERRSRVRLFLYRVRVDPKSTDALGDGLFRTDAEELPLPDGIDDDDVNDLASTVALVRIAGDGGPITSSSVGTTHLFYRAHGIDRDE